MIFTKFPQFFNFFNFRRAGVLNALHPHHPTQITTTAATSALQAGVIAIGFALAQIGTAASAQTQQAVTAAPNAGAVNPKLDRAALSVHPWQAPFSAIRGAEAYFTNLKDGDVIETPFLVKFGLSGGWGLAPISKPISGKSGHHHLLINRDLPLDFKKSLPFDEQYIHFGKGQMEKVLTLAPGTYTLRMLLADDQHLPHFVFSKPTKITVSKKTTTPPENLVKKGVFIDIDTLQTDGVGIAEVSGPFRMQMHASGLNVAHQSQLEKDTGHFKLSFFPKGNGGEATGKPLAEMAFKTGETEVWLLPPVGDYMVRLELVDNLQPTKNLADAALVPLRIKARS